MPSNPWFVLKSGLTDPALNMAMDEALLTSVAALGRPVLRFYGWTKPAATFGYFQHYCDIEQWTALRPLIRRPTGGGLVRHDADWTYSAVFPPGHAWHQLRAEESYAAIHAWIRDAFALLGVESELSPCCRKEIAGQCFVGAEKFDLLWKGRKIAGAAQRRNQDGLLIQGSVQSQPPGVPLAEWQRAMLESAAQKARAEWSELPADARLMDKAGALAREKYSALEFTTRR